MDAEEILANHRRLGWRFFAAMQKILIIEDDQAIQKELQHLFESAGYTVAIKTNPRSALEAVYEALPTAIVLDPGLPVLSRQDLCVQIKRRLPTIPIIVLGASSDIVDKVLLLELGADDYVTKPFDSRELLARVRAAIRSTHKAIIHDETKFDEICVDFTRMEVNREGRTIVMTTAEFRLLEFFLHNEGRDISREELLEKALGYHDYSSLRTIDNHILKLRQKLERDPENPIHFCTAYRAGYKFVR
jgi:DNA-binding response OmpR family regulator